MILNGKQFQDKAKKQRYKACWIFDGYEPTENRNPFDKIGCKTVEEFQKEIKDFISLYPGKFTIITATCVPDLGKCASTILTNFETVEITTPTSEPAFDLNGIEDRIRQNILVEITAKHEAEAKEKELKEALAEVAEMKTTGGQLAFLIQHLISGVVTPGTALSMQGMEPQEISEDQASELDTALGILVREFGAKALINFANDPGKMQMAKNFI